MMVIMHLDYVYVNEEALHERCWEWALEKGDRISDRNGRRSVFVISSFSFFCCLADILCNIAEFCRIK